MAFLSPDFIFQNHQHHYHHHHNDMHHEHDHHSPSIIPSPSSNSNPQEYFPLGPPLSLLMNNNPMPSFSHHHDHNNPHAHHQGGDDEYDDHEVSDDHDGSSSHVVVGVKKKRLEREQVKMLEKSFEMVGSKLEPERKLELAKSLGLHPRQVAIWFQNRRARCKTKQLEKDYNLLKRQFDALQSDHDSLLSLNNQLHAELMALRSKESREHEPINLNNKGDKRNGYWSNNTSKISSDNINIANLHCPQINPQPLQHDALSTMFVVGGGAGGGSSGRSDCGGVDGEPPPTFWPWLEQQP